MHDHVSSFRCKCGKCGRVHYMTVHGKSYTKRDITPPGWIGVVSRKSLKQEWRCNFCVTEEGNDNA